MPAAGDPVARLLLAKAKTIVRATGKTATKRKGGTKAAELGDLRRLIGLQEAGVITLRELARLVRQWRQGDLSG